MALNEAFYEKLIDGLYDGVYYVDINRTIIYWNKSCERITGYSRAQVVGRSCKDNLLNHCTESGGELCLQGCPLTATIGDGAPREADVFLHHADGHRVPVRVRVAPIQDANGQIIGAVETFSNNSDLFTTRHKVAQLQEVATRDPLTGVGNRLFGEARLQAAFLEFNLTREPFGLLFIDLDNFKRANDTFGHEAGDHLLRMVAVTLSSNLRQDDSIIRWGGEEFLVILKTSEKDSLLRAAEKLRNLIEHSAILVLKHSVSVSASIGASLAQISDTPESLIARADQLMYTSKSLGKNRVTVG